MLNEVHRINLRVTENTKKGDVRIEALKRIQLLALQEGKQFELFDSRLVWWGLSMTDKGYNALRVRKEAAKQAEQEMKEGL